MTYTIFDVDKSTMAEFTANVNDHVRLTVSFISGSSPIEVDIHIDELKRLSDLLTEDLNN